MTDNGADSSVDDLVAEVVSKVAESPSLDSVIISNGVKFSIKKVPPRSLRRISETRPVPRPPIWKNLDKERDEENPNDPEYLEQLRRYQLEIGDATLRLFLVLGTEVKEIPEGIQKPEDDWWSEALSLVDIEASPKGSPQRYLSWLLDYLLTEPSDIETLYIAVLRKSEILQEEAVQRAVESFRGGVKRGTDTASPSEESSGHGDPLPIRATRGRPRSRGT